MRTALVTGHRGFVGTHIAQRLADDGWMVTGCDIADHPRYRRDCRDLFATDDTVWDLVVHAAAIVGGRLTISNDPLAIAVDLEIDAAMFRWAVRTKQKRVVYFSSSAAYPTRMQEGSSPRPLAETDMDVVDGLLGVPDAVYGWSKVTGELLAACAEAEGVPVHVFRPFSGYGPGQSLDYPFPTYIERAQRASPDFHVWGDGRQVRDFVHIDDVVGCVMAAIDQDFRAPLNIGTGRPTNFNQLAKMCMAEAGYSAPIFHDTTKPTGPSYRVADVTRMLSVYAPKVSLEEGIRRALAS